MPHPHAERFPSAASVMWCVRSISTLTSFGSSGKTRSSSLMAAMNAGVYEEDLSPVGLYVEGGETLRAEAKRVVFDQNRAFNEKSSADAFPQVFFLIQLIDFHSHEITPRDNTPDPTALDDWDMTKAVSAHLPQRVDCAVIGRNRDWIGCHRVRQRGYCGILTFGKSTHRVAAGEDATQALLFVDN